MKILYFAWLRTKIGLAAETVEPPGGIRTVAELVEWLKERGPNYADALANTAVVKVAVNQEYVPYSHPLRASDEVALFPPVTGG